MKFELGSDGFRQIFDTAPDAMVIVDAEGAIVLVNQQVERLFGFAREELLGQKIEVLVPRRYRDRHTRDRAKFTSAPSSRAMGSGLELYGMHRDGREFPVEISLSPVSVAQGKVVAASIRDVSLQRQLQAKTNRLQQDLLSAIDSIEGSFFIWDAEDCLVVSNNQARTHWGGGLQGSLNGRPWSEVIDANIAVGAFDTEDLSVQAFRERLAQYHQKPAGAFSARTASGRSVRLVERRTPEGGTVGLITDVTDDMQRERELQQARSEAEAASSAKSEFLSSMSHELRTPLNAVLGFAQLLQRDKKTPLSPRHLERVEHILRGGEHLLHLIDDVLDLARIEAGRVPVSVEPVSIPAVLEEVQATMSSMAERAAIALQLRLPVELVLPEVNADRTRLKQILTNFTSNAIKYGRHGGNVCIDAEWREGVVRLTVRDDGMGIAEEQQHKIFEPFQRAGQESGAIEGTGIGLTISKRLAELMGGRVGFESTLHQGSAFWVEFPARSARQARSQRVELNDARRPRGEDNKRLVVYIEDNPSNLAFMADVLDDFPNIELLTATSAELGLELVRDHQPALVIMDINLPGMNGIAALEQLQRMPETRDIPVVALSAAAMRGEARRIERAGFCRYLTKPVRVAELTETLEELLGA